MSEVAPRVERAVTPIAYGQHGVQLHSIEDLYRFGRAVVESGLAPSAFRKPEQVVVAVQYGAELGLGPMQSLQSIAVINGKPSLMVEPALALVRRSGLLVGNQTSWDGEAESRRCVVALTRVGGEVLERSFSMTDAKRAGLSHKDIWKAHPDRMLYARAMGFALRDLFSDVLRGIGIAEEVADYAPPSRPVTIREEPIGPDPLLAQLESGQAQTIDVSGSAQGEGLAVVGTGEAEADAQSAALPEIPMGLRKEIEKRVQRLIPSAQEMAHEHIGALVQEMMLAGAKHAQIATAIRDWKLPQ